MRILLALLASLACVAGFDAAAQSRPASPQRIVLLVDEYKAIRNFPLIVAERLGYLEGEGAQVTVMNIRDDIPTAQMLADGRIDAVMAYYHHNIVNQAEGRDFEAIVTLGVTPGARVLVANHARDKYRTAADLKGARIIAGGAGSSKTSVANYLVIAGGHKLTDYTRIANESKDKIAAALRGGEADLVVAPTPDGAYYEAQGVATLFADLTTVEGTKRAFGVVFPSSTIYMASERIKSNPEIARLLARAFVRALRFINTHSAEEIAAVIPDSIAGKDRASDLRVLEEEITMFATDGGMPPEAAEREFRVLAEFNPKLKAVKIERTYTNRFVDEALARDK